jgi:hypothetical protein
MAASCARGSSEDAATPVGPGQGTDAGAASDEASVDGAMPLQQPAWTPPTKMADRVGVYAWGFDDTAFAASPDRLSWSSAKVHDLGSQTVRVYLGPSDPYKVGLDPASSLVDVARSPAYAALFASSSFHAYLLTAYTKDDEGSTWLSGYTPASAAAERAAFADLTAYLIATYPGKTFILLDWEGDNAIGTNANDPGAWDGFLAWTQARADGVRDGRTKASSSAHVFSGVEFNRVTGCDEAASRCVSSFVLPRVDVDFYSYSSWASTGLAVDDASVGMHLASDLDQALAFARKRDPKVGPSRFVVGELGAMREEFGECRAAQRVATLAAAATSWGAPYAVFWQIVDNHTTTAVGATKYGFGALKPDLSPSLTAPTLQTLFATETAAVPSKSCATVNPGGVVDGVNFAQPLHLSNAVTVFGSGFGPKTVVRVAQREKSFTVSDGTPAFYRSSGQINFMLPQGITTGDKVLVYVRNDDGLDSNGQWVDLFQ